MNMEIGNSEETRREFCKVYADVIYDQFVKSWGNDIEKVHRVDIRKYADTFSNSVCADVISLGYHLVKTP